MSPVAYTGRFADKVWYVGKTLYNGSEVWFASPNGEQPTNGLIFPNRAELDKWLSENGFTIKQQVVQ